MPTLANLDHYLKQHGIPRAALARAIGRRRTTLQCCIGKGYIELSLIRDIESVLIADKYPVPNDLWINTDGFDCRASQNELRSLKDYRVITCTADSVLARYRSKVARKQIIEPLLAKELTVEPLSLNTLKEFGLRRDPFRREILGRDDVFWSKEHEYVVQLMLNAAKCQDFVAIIAEVGAGKTLCLTQFREDRPENIRIIEPSFPDKKRINPGGILDAIIIALGGSEERIPARNEAKADKTRRMLEDLEKSGKYAVLLLDEAHDFAQNTIRSLKRLHEMDRGFAKLLGIILVGQMELLDVLNNESIREVSQRCARYVMQGLNGSTQQYIEFKFARVGSKIDKIFDASAIKAIELICSKKVPNSRKRVGPFPLKLNVVISQVMNHAAKNGLTPITDDVVYAAWGVTAEAIR